MCSQIFDPNMLPVLPSTNTILNPLVEGHSRETYSLHWHSVFHMK